MQFRDDTVRTNEMLVTLRGQRVKRIKRKERRIKQHFNISLMLKSYLYEGNYCNLGKGCVMR